MLRIGGFGVIANNRQGFKEENRKILMSQHASENSQPSGSKLKATKPGCVALISSPTSPGIYFGLLEKKPYGQ